MGKEQNIFQRSDFHALSHKILEGSDPLLMSQNTTSSVGLHHLQSVAPPGGGGMHFALSLEDQWSMSSQMGTLKLSLLTG